jgi:hypothetical protein
MASSSSSGEGATILWATLKGKKVKSNDGKDVGEIKEVSQILVPILNSASSRVG